eukprot:CAMPEP_0172605336 /NCGR_PEP_ID=MMETSP1068-20121228/25576_1 /TAXON_ID=35684 /ORGANISM="Pseudopedinella elastica, Strain CCMP716" /LENGTH=82 /DNA_ID=CAMNT_0013407705 /DNA_START=275 /DNA_END=520 /DNA_ORIENTATION=-
MGPSWRLYSSALKYALKKKPPCHDRSYVPNSPLNPYRRRSHSPHVFEYTAAVGPEQGRGICREGVWPIRGAQQVESSGGSAV